MSTLQHRDAIDQAEGLANRAAQLKALFIAIERTACGAQNYVTCPDFELQQIRQLAELGTDNADRLYSVTSGLHDVIKFDLGPVTDGSAVAEQVAASVGQKPDATTVQGDSVIVQKPVAEDRKESIERLRDAVDERQWQLHGVLCALDTSLAGGDEHADTLALASAAVRLSRQAISEYSQLYCLIDQGVAA